MLRSKPAMNFRLIACLLVTAAACCCLLLGLRLTHRPTCEILAAEPGARPQRGAKTVSDKSPKTVLVIHGGAGVLSLAEMADEHVSRGDYEKALVQALAAGYAALQHEKKTSVDAVEAAIRVLEDCELFNAGR